MRFSFIPIIMLLMPFAEIAGFVLVGQWLGLWATLGLVVASSIFGLFILRYYGIGALMAIRTEGRNGRAPGREMINAGVATLAGVLLVLPGFITDIIGLLFLIPAVRRAAWAMISPNVTVMRSGQGASPFQQRTNPFRNGGRQEGPVVDLSDDDFQRKPDGNSPWSPGRTIDNDKN